MLVCVLPPLLAVASVVPGATNGWHGPIDVTYGDKDCPNVGCHGPWPGHVPANDPLPCESICNGVKGCNAMNFNGGGCCLRACAPGKQITANRTGGGGLSYYRVGPAPPSCTTIKVKSECLEPYCTWNGQRCTVPPPPPPPLPPPPPCSTCTSAAECTAHANVTHCVWNSTAHTCSPPPPPPPPPACTNYTTNVTCPMSHDGIWWHGRCIWNWSNGGSCQPPPRFAPTNPRKPLIKLGVADFGLAESTPVLWKGRLVRFDSVHIEYGRPVGCVAAGSPKAWDNMTHSPSWCRDPAMVDSAGNPRPYYRVVDPVTHEVISTSFGMGHVFGSALVQPAEDSMNHTDTFWVWGVNAGFGPKISSFYSTDLQTWINGTAFEIKNATQVGFSGMCNNAVTRLDTPKGTPPAYVMAIESNGNEKGLDLSKTQCATTFAYLNSSNLSSGWTQFNPRTHQYTSREYSACPTIRHYNGWYYVATLFSPAYGNAPRYQQVLVRSRDLQTWSGPTLPDVSGGSVNTSRPGYVRTGNGTKYNPILSPLFDEANDRKISPAAWNYKTELTAAQLENIEVASDGSNSDMDWSDDGRGGVYITYGWSNQVSFSNMFLAAAEVRNATQQEWLESFFDD